MSAIAFISVDGDLCEIADTMLAPLYDRLVAVKPPNLTLNAWAVKAGVSRTFFNDVRKRGNANHDSIVKVLDAAGVSLAQFEAGEQPVKTEVRGTGMSVADVERAWRSAEPSKPVPLLGSAIGGEWQDQVELTELHLGEVLDYIARPPSVANDKQAYAVTIVGDSMAPRFEPGERAYVSPRSPASIGDDVIVQLLGNGEDQTADRVTMVLIKRLVRRTPAYVELRQFNPETTFQVPTNRVAAIHRVVGRL